MPIQSYENSGAGDTPEKALEQKASSARVQVGIGRTDMNRAQSQAKNSRFLEVSCVHGNDNFSENEEVYI